MPARFVRPPCGSFSRHVRDRLAHRWRVQCARIGVWTGSEDAVTFGARTDLLPAERGTMAKRKAPPEPLYAPEDLDPNAPRLYISRNGAGWELRSEERALLGVHESQSRAIDAAREISKVRFTEILVEGSTGRYIWQLDQDPEWLAIAERLGDRLTMWDEDEQ